MRNRVVPLAAMLMGLTGTAGAAQPPTLNIPVDTNAAVNACIPAAERQRPLSQIGPARRRTIVACIFAATAAQINAQLPTQIDEVTRLDRITVAGPQLTYHYTVSMRVADLPENAAVLFESGTRAHVCGRQDMRQTMDMGGSYIYHWVDPDGREIYRMTVTSC